jgi:hypothetical protein
LNDLAKDTITERFSPDGIKPDVDFGVYTHNNNNPLDRARNSINSSTKRKHIAQALCHYIDAPLSIFPLKASRE